MSQKPVVEWSDKIGSVKVMSPAKEPAAEGEDQFYRTIVELMIASQIRRAKETGEE